jgi:hypothetical protein
MDVEGDNRVSMRTLEAAILKELRRVTGNKKIQQKDIQEWGTHDVSEGTRNDEVFIALPALGVTVSYKEPE